MTVLLFLLNPLLIVFIRVFMLFWGYHTGRNTTQPWWWWLWILPISVILDLVLYAGMNVYPNPVALSASCAAELLVFLAGLSIARWKQWRRAGMAVALSLVLVSASLAGLVNLQVLQQAQQPQKALAESGNGPSVDITYQPQPHIFHDYTYERVKGTESYTRSYYSTSYMMEDDGAYWEFYFKATAGEDYIEYWITFTIPSPYSQLKQVKYDFKAQALSGLGTPEDFEVTLYIYGESASTYVTQTSHNTWKTGTLTLGSQYVVDGEIHGRFKAYFYDADTSLSALALFVDQLAFEYDAVTETRRSTYNVVGGTLRYEVGWTTWDYDVNATVKAPSGWSFQSVQPSCTYGSGAETFMCPVPEDYTAVFTADVLATANWREIWSDSYEDGVRLGTDAWQYKIVVEPETLEQGYTVVADGAASLHQANTVGTTGKIKLILPSYLVGTRVWVVVNVYRVSGVAKVGMYDAGAWRAVAASDTGRWETLVWSFEPSVAAIWIETQGTPAEAFWDNIMLFNSSVQVGETITGTCRHIHPNGYVPAAYTEVQLGLWDASYSWVGYQSATTDSDGEWSLPASSFGTLSSQTYRLWTWVYCDANSVWPMDARTESTTDWQALGGGVTVGTSSTAKEGTVSVEVAGGFTTLDYIVAKYDPTDTAVSGLLVFWFRLNNTASVDTSTSKIVISDASGNKWQDKTLLTSYGFTADAWVRIAKPLEEEYWGVLGAFDPDSWNWFQINLYNSSTQVGKYQLLIDGLNFISSFTSDSLPVYQLGMTSVSFEKINGHESLFLAEGEAYSGQLYEIKLDGEAVATGVPSGTIVARNSTVGTHTYTVTATSLTSGAAHLDSAVFSYVYNVSAVWTVTGVFSLSDVKVHCFVDSNFPASYVVYENDSSVASGSVASGGATITWTRDITPGVILVGVKLSYGSETRWLNTSYSNPVAEALKLTVWANWFDGDKIRVYYETNWLNTTIYCYDNGTLLGSHPEGYANFTKSDTVGLHLVGFKVDGGAMSIWVNRSYTVAAPDTLELEIFSVQLVEGWVAIHIQTNWRNCTVTVVEELPSGVNETRLQGVAEADCTGYQADRAVGNHTLYITIDGGAQTLVRTASFRVLPEPGLRGGGYDPRVAQAVWAGTAIILVAVVLSAVSIIVILRGIAARSGRRSTVRAPASLTRVQRGMAAREAQLRRQFSGGGRRPGRR